MRHVFPQFFRRHYPKTTWIIFQSFFTLNNFKYFVNMKILLIFYRIFLFEISANFLPGHRMKRTLRVFYTYRSYYSPLNQFFPRPHDSWIFDAGYKSHMHQIVSHPHLPAHYLKGDWSVWCTLRHELIWQHWRLLIHWLLFPVPIE